MSYQSTNQLDPRRNLFIDLHEVAQHIQYLLEPALQPHEPGMYLPGQLEPTLKSGRFYWYQEPVFTPAVAGTGQYYRYRYVPLYSFDDIILHPWDIVDSNGEGDRKPQVVLPHHMAHLASAAPSVPVQAIKILRQVIQTEIDSTRIYAQGRAMLLEEIIMPYLHAPFQNLEALRHDLWFQEAISLIFDSLIPILGPIRDSLRHNPYQMCTVFYHDAYQLRVEQLGDYRVMEWERITRDPEYQRWLKAKASGEWDQYVHAKEEAQRTGQSQRMNIQVPHH